MSDGVFRDASLCRLSLVASPTAGAGREVERWLMLIMRHCVFLVLSSTIRVAAYSSFSHQQSPVSPLAPLLDLARLERLMRADEECVG